MRSLNINEIQAVSGGDNDGNEGEALATQISQATGGRPADCNIYGHSDGTIYYSCVGEGGSYRGGNIVISADEGGEDEDA